MFCTSRKLATSPVVEEWVQDARRCGTTDNYQGKRAFARTTWNATLAIRILTGPDKGLVIMVKARDVSLGGVGFLSRQKIDQHTRLEICAGNNTRSVIGRVVHTTNTLGGQIVGVEFETKAPIATRRLAG
ncbi:MAG: PilZ domain-containing protein [Phycisphaerae bacterium]|nr:PilZ domain-containing protein [Phycisphaerales bacterium]